MTLAKKLKFLEYASIFNVKQDEKDDSIYEITFVHQGIDLAAIIDLLTQEISYYRMDCYNSGVDYLEIDIDNLGKLKEFAELLLKGD